MVWLLPFFGRRGGSSATPRGSGANRRRRTTARPRPGALGQVEPLESKQLLAVDVLAPIGTQALNAAAGAAVEITLADRFALTDVVGTVVRVETNAPRANPHFFVELFDTVAAAPVRTTPATAANFLGYVDDGSYDRSIVHRSVPGFVIQGGGFKVPAAPADQPGGSPTAVVSRGNVPDEVGNPNQRGTLAMAKVAPPGGQPTPNSATNQWFVNLVDNVELDPNFSAFGRVLGTGMTVVDAIAAASFYNAADYFSNPALGSLPLWEVPTSGVIQPGNFVTITDMSRATPGQLVSYTATVADPSLLRTSLVGDRLVLSRVGVGAGTTSVTLRAAAAFDPGTFVDQVFQVTLPAVPQTPDVTIESQGAVALRRDWTGRLTANGQAVTLGGVTLNYHDLVFGGWTAVAAEAVGGVNTLVLRHSSGNLHYWRLNGSWAQTSSDGWVAPATPAYHAAEVTFATDFDGDGLVGLTLTPVESAGSVVLATDGNGNLRANGTLITFGGAPFRHTTSPTAEWRVMAAETIGGVNTVVLRHSSGNLHFWRMDAGWRQVSSDGWVAPGSATFHATELAFGVDLDGNGSVTVEAAGAVTLTYDTSGNLRANGTALTFNGGPVNYQAMVAGGWTPMAAEADQGVNTIVLRHSSGNLHSWRMNAGWAQVSGDGWVAPRSNDFFASEVTYGVDLDRDGRLTIETAGSVSLSYDAEGNLRAGETLVIFNGGPMNYHRMVEAGWRAVAAELHVGLNTIVLRHASGFLHFWRLDSSWNQVSGDGWVELGSRRFFTTEAFFGADLDGDGTRTIEAAGSAILTYDRAGAMRVGTTPVIFNGAPASFFGALAAGWNILAAELNQTRNTILLRHVATGHLHFWRFDTAWNQVSGDGWVAPGSPGVLTTETAFGVDINGNRTVGT